jgi:hypothetical protein
LDPVVRLKDYLVAFEYYWKLPDELVAGVSVFENSGQDFLAFEEIVNRNPCDKKSFLYQQHKSIQQKKEKDMESF